MASLSAQDILRVWESGLAQDPVARAVAILVQASPGTAREALAALPVGHRDARLMAVREETFGAIVDGVCPCPQCRERVEFRLELPELRASAPSGDGLGEGELELAGCTVRYRLPSSDDLAASLEGGTPEEATRLLAERCILGVRSGQHAVALAALPPRAFSHLAAAMAEQDPLAEVMVGFVCPTCGHPGETLFDIAAYFWEEIRAQALRLLREVAGLARAYGWREADILALSPERRRAYLELAAG